MKAPGFWWRADGGAAAALLSPIGAIVGTVAARRMRRPPAARLGIKVVCVGNPTVGGAGKTPVALAIADALAQRGARPVFLTRGYGGRLAGPVRVEPHHDARDVGDEPLLLAQHHPTVVAADRAAGGRLAETIGSVVVMDDGFQNPGLAKDVSLLVVDGAVGLGNGLVTPAGPLRAPFAAQEPFAHALLVTGVGETPHALPQTQLLVHHVRLAASGPAELAGARVLAFAGIGRPQKFFRSVADLGADTVVREGFADHGMIGERTAGDLLAAARAQGLTLVTTRKDAVRLAAGGPQARALGASALIVDVRAELPEALVEMVSEGCGLGPAPE